MNSKIRATYKWVAPILLSVFGAFLINNTKENIKMAWPSIQSLYNQINPLDGGRTYQTDQMGANPGSGFDFGQAGSSGGGGGGVGSWSDAPQVQGASTYAGSMYLDTTTGKVMQLNADGTRTPVMNDVNPNPTNSRYNSDGTPYVAPDPFAQWGGKAAYDAQVGEINTGKSNALNSATASQDASLRSGRSNILDFIGGATTKQQGIDQSRANAQFSLQEGKGDIMDMVGRGVRSGGVMLANKNAGSSGAAGQIARAYGELGNREARDVGNQFALENQGIDLQQNELNTGFETQKRKIDEFKIGQAEEIAGTARNALAALEATRVGASLPQLFAIDQEVQAIKDATMAKLSELDSLLQSERSKINPAGQQQTMAKANEMRTAGTGGPQMFNFNTNAAQMQAQGPSVAGAELPIYSNMALNKRRGV